ncbi:TPA: hypothetical protein EYO77_15235 [Candidatus Poribacteria bacterium]|nr:hypothetical protein [Candidatus Poribacteria bacterium]
MHRIFVLFLFLCFFTVMEFEADSQILIDGTRQKVHGLYYSADDEIIAATTSSGVNLYNTKKRKRIFAIRLPDVSKQVAFEVKRHWIAVLVSTGTIHVWDIQGQKKVFTIQAEQIKKEIADIWFISSGLYVGLIDGTLLKFNIGQTKPKQVIGANYSYVTELRFIPTSKHQFVIRHNNKISFHSFRKTLWEGINGSDVNMNMMAFSPLGDQMALVRNNIVEVRDCQTGDMRNLMEYDDKIVSFCFARQPNVAVSASSDNTIQVWNLSANRITKTYRYKQVNSPIQNLACAGNGKQFAFATAEGKIWLGGEVRRRSIAKQVKPKKAQVLAKKPKRLVLKATPLPPYVVAVGETIEIQVDCSISAMIRLFTPIDNTNFDSNRNLFRWTPDFSQIGEKNIRFLAETKDGRSTSLDLDIEVQSINVAPVFTQIGAFMVREVPTPKLTVNEGEVLDTKVQAYDRNGDPLTYTATDLPSDAQFDKNRIRWEPSFDFVSTEDLKTEIPVTLTVSDGELDTKLPITIVVFNIEQPEEQPAENTQVDLRPPDQMIRVPESNFVIGIDSDISEKSGNTVFTLAFDVDRFEVTNAEYVSFLNSYQRVVDTDGRVLISLDSQATKIEKTSNGYQVQSVFERHPVVGVSWYGAQTYAEWAGKRLLTETEWEWIARGNNQRLFPWGNQPPDRNLLNYRSKAPVPVGSYPRGANPLGIHDLAGNVAEWVTAKKVPGKAKIVRGGSWKSLNPRSVRTTARFPLLPDQMISWVGFRCARDIEN